MLNAKFHSSYLFESLNEPQSLIFNSLLGLGTHVGTILGSQLHISKENTLGLNQKFGSKTMKVV